MSDQAVVLDCSLAGPPLDEFVDAIREEALALLEAGEMEKAAALMKQATAAHAASQLPPETTRPLTEAELAQRDADQAKIASEAAARKILDDNASSMRDKVGQALGNLENATGNWGTLTAAQKDAAMKLTIQVVVRLARLAIRQLDAAP